MEKWRRIVIVLIGFFESIAFAGCIFGWPSLLFILQAEGIYSHLCKGLKLENISLNENNTDFGSDIESIIDDNLKNETEVIFQFTNETTFPLIQDIPIIRCKEQDGIFGLIFTTSVVVYGVPAILIGFSLDKLGLRVTRIFGSLCITMGFISLSLCTKENSWLVWPGMILIGLGTNPLRLGALQYSNLFPKRRSTILFAYTAGHSISTTLFLLFQFAYAWGISLQHICLTMTIVSSMTFVSTWIMPCMKTEHEESSRESRISGLTERRASNFSVKERLSIVSEVTETGESGPIPLKESIMTLSFLLHVIWHFNLYMLRFYVTSFNTWVYMTTDDSKQVGHYNTIMGLAALISPLFSPLCGLITDCLMRKADKEDDKVERLRKHFAAPSLILFLATFLMFGVKFSKFYFTPTAVYVSILLVSVARPLLVGSIYSHVRIRFYPEHFNRLTGFGFTLVSLLSIFQYPLFVWHFSSDSSYNASNVMMCLIIVISLASPIHLNIKRLTRKYAKSQLRFRKDI